MSPTTTSRAATLSAWTLEDYRAVFRLTDAEMSGRLLCVPGGAHSFTAQVRARGGHAVAVDPAYATGLQRLAIDALTGAERDHQRNLTQAPSARKPNPDDAAQQRRAMLGAAHRFVSDRVRHPEDYLAGALPRLPIRTGSVDLVLSAHLLFVHPERLDLTFHRVSIRELLRVCRGQVRIHPIVDARGRPYPVLDELRGELRRAGVRSWLAETDGRIFDHGDHTLVLTRKS